MASWLMQIPPYSTIVTTTSVGREHERRGTSKARPAFPQGKRRARAAAACAPRRAAAAGIALLAPRCSSDQHSRLLEMLADAPGDVAEFGRLAQRKAPRPRERHPDVVQDRAGPPRHHDHPVGAEDRLEDAVGDQERRDMLAAWTCCSVTFIWSRVKASSALNGSSRSSIAGRAARRGQWPRAGACRPIVPRDRRSAKSATPSSASNSPARASRPHALELGRQQHVVDHAAPIQQQVALEHDADIGHRPAHLLAPMRCRHCVGASSPATMRSSVLLPHPRGQRRRRPRRLCSSAL